MSIEYFDIQALNRSTTGTFSYDSGSPVLQFAIGDVEKYLIGNYDRYVDYQYFYLNQNQPNQLVPLERVANKLPESIHLDQLTKAIDGAEYPVNNLRHFEICFWIGRGVSYGRGSLNLDAKDLMLKINTTSSGLQYNTLFNHYVISLRRLRVSNGDLEVFY